MLTLPGLSLASSPIILGVADFGASIDEHEAYGLMDRYVEAGGNHFDTAHIYAAWIAGKWGVSERVLGRWLRSRGLAGKVILSTKGAHMLLDEAKAPRVRPECIHADLSESLDRLGVDHIQVYYLHRDDERVPVEPILAALEAERQRGRIGVYACSNWSVARMREAQALARLRGWSGFAINQAGWSLAATPAAGPLQTRYVDAEMRAWHATTRLPLACYSSQAVGFFARSWQWPLTAEPAGKFTRYVSEANIHRAQRAQHYAAARGVSPTRIALAWLLAQPHPVLPVVGCKNLAHLDDSMAAMQIRLSPAEVADLERG